MLKQRTYNVEVGCFGVPGSGKSDYALNFCLDEKRRLGGQLYLIAHDAGYSIPKKLHNGRPTGVLRYDSIESARVGLVKHPGAFHAISVPDAGEVIGLAQEVAWMSLCTNTPGGESKVKEGEGIGVPVLIYIDEIVRSQDANPRYLGPQLTELIACRRHFHCGLVFTSQSPHLCHYALGSQATEIVMFRLNDDDDVKRLHKRMNVPKEMAQKSKSLPKHQYVRFAPDCY